MAEYLEKLYKEVECKWGLKPDFILTHFLDLIPKGTALDLGMGEGRNAIFLAEMGFEVEGIDISKTAIDRCLQLAKESNISIKAYISDIRDFKIPKQKYSLIVAAGASLNFLKRSEVGEVITKMKRGVKNGGFIYTSIISTDEPLYKKLKKKQTPVEENTFYVPHIGTYVHYFTYKEIKELFSDFQTIIHLGGLELDFHNKPHHHGIIYYLGMRK